jgi:hypothetical protein
LTASAHSQLKGGAVLHALTPNLHPLSNQNADIDLFLYGLSDAQAREKIKRLFEIAKNQKGCKSPSTKPCVLRTQHTVTFVFAFPNRNVSVILRLHDDAPQVVQCFDVDCCGFYYNGKTVKCTVRAALALRTRCNVMVEEKRTPAYVQRLLKYVRRGYSIAVPGLKWDDNAETRRMWTKKRKPVETQPIPYYYPGGDECDKKKKYDYFEATQMEKLLLACKAGRKVFTSEIDRGTDTYPMLKRLYPNINPGHAIQTRRSKFPPRLQNTKVFALLYFSELLVENEDEYDVDMRLPLGHFNDLVAWKVDGFLSAKKKGKGRVEFQIGGIPTGRAELLNETQGPLFNIPKEEHNEYQEPPKLEVVNRGVRIMLAKFAPGSASPGSSAKVPIVL